MTFWGCNPEDSMWKLFYFRIGGSPAAEISESRHIFPCYPTNKPFNGYRNELCATFKPLQFEQMQFEQMGVVHCILGKRRLWECTKCNVRPFRVARMYGALTEQKIFGKFLIFRLTAAKKSFGSGGVSVWDVHSFMRKHQQNNSTQAACFLSHLLPPASIKLHVDSKSLGINGTHVKWFACLREDGYAIFTCEEDPVQRLNHFSDLFMAKRRKRKLKGHGDHILHKRADVS
jgi:hypothetical protein